MHQAPLLVLLVLVLTCAGCGNDSDAPGDVSVVGTWTLDRENYVAGMEERWLKEFGSTLQELPAAELAKQKESLLAAWESTEFDLALNEIGSFQVTATREDTTDVIRGTWTQEGDAVLLEETEMNGEPKEPPVRVQVTLRDGQLLYRPDPGFPFPIRLKKR